MSTTVISAIVFLVLLRCATCYNPTTNFVRERQDIGGKIQPNELTTNNYPILNKSNSVFKKGDILEVKISKLFSNKTKQYESYYSLPFCGSNSSENSTYVFKMLEPQMCNVVCRVTLDYETATKFQSKMEDKYNVNMILDGLPLVMQRSSDVYQIGYPIGDVLLLARFIPRMYSINNHLVFTVKYHKDPQTNSMKIVEFLVQPRSFDYKFVGKRDENGNLTTCNSSHLKYLHLYWQEVRQLKEIIFTYDVLFEEVLDHRK